VTSPGEILGLVQAGPATLGSGRLLCIDGRAGSGKTSLASLISALAPATVVHTDDLCPGWDGLAQVPQILAGLLEPLAAGLPGRYPRYDWIAGRTGEDVVIEPAELVIVEGVGAGDRALRPWRTALVWLEGGSTMRQERALARDGDAFAPYWDRWAAAEEAYLASTADREHADVILPG
jgi:uridine kinase